MTCCGSDGVAGAISLSGKLMRSSCSSWLPSHTVCALGCCHTMLPGTTAGLETWVREDTAFAEDLNGVLLNVHISQLTTTSNPAPGNVISSSDHEGHCIQVHTPSTHTHTQLKSKYHFLKRHHLQMKMVRRFAFQHQSNYCATQSP